MLEIVTSLTTATITSAATGVASFRTTLGNTRLDVDASASLRGTFTQKIDLLSGGSFLREWVDNLNARQDDFQNRRAADERVRSKLRRPFLMY